MSIKVLSVYFLGEARAPVPNETKLTSADQRDGYEIQYDGAVYSVRNELRWGDKFIQVPAARTMSAICEAVEDEPEEETMPEPAGTGLAPKRVRNRKPAVAP